MHIKCPYRKPWALARGSSLSLPQYRSIEFLTKNKDAIKKIAGEVYRKKAAISELLCSSEKEMYDMALVLGLKKEERSDSYFEVPIYHEMLSIGELVAIRAYPKDTPELLVVVDSDNKIDSINYESLVTQDKCAVINAVHHILETCGKRLNQEKGKCLKK